MTQYLNNVFTKFKRDERGAITVFIVGIFTTMILIGGTAIDLMRVEAVRSSIQYNLDRAVLAAASMRQVQDPEAVVVDYMSRVETLSTFSVSMDAANTSVSLTGRKVSASATATINTYFLRIAGINTWDVTATSRATEEIPNLEISLVLDVSGSMYGSKIASLKTAAKTFVDTVIIEGTETLTAVSIVPYSTNVTVPQSMWDLYTTDETTTHTRCMVFDEDDFDVAAISTTDTQQQLSYFSRSGGLKVSLYYSACKTKSYAEIFPFSTSVPDLQNKIDSLVASGYTATHIGTKWGVALLDPAANPIAADIGGEVASLPEAYTAGGVLKVLVVMTDGQNTSHYRMGDAYRTGPSDMYYVTEVITKKKAVCTKKKYLKKFIKKGKNSSKCHYEDVTVENSKYYIYRPNNGNYYAVVNNAYYYYGNNVGSTLPGNPAAVVGEDGYQRRLNWPEVWETISTRAYSYTIRGNGSGYRYRDAYSSDADAQTLAACSAAKNNGVLVYTIAFQAPFRARTLLRNCASSPSTYYDVSTTSIEDAFASIAVSVQKLKLTQ